MVEKEQFLQSLHGSQERAVVALMDLAEEVIMSTGCTGKTYIILLWPIKS
jgi:hypothetical protein